MDHHLDHARRPRRERPPDCDLVESLAALVVAALATWLGWDPDPEIRTWLQRGADLLVLFAFDAMREKGEG